MKVKKEYFYPILALTIIAILFVTFSVMSLTGCSKQPNEEEIVFHMVKYDTEYKEDDEHFYTYERTYGDTFGNSNVKCWLITVYYIREDIGTLYIYYYYAGWDSTTSDYDCDLFRTERVML